MYRATHCARNDPLPLLPSGPGGVGGITSRRTRHTSNSSIIRPVIITRVGWLPSYTLASSPGILHASFFLSHCSPVCPRLHASNRRTDWHIFPSRRETIARDPDGRFYDESKLTASGGKALSDAGTFYLIAPANFPLQRRSLATRTIYVYTS
jgi:hypothetical protein